VLLILEDIAVETKTRSHRNDSMTNQDSSLAQQHADDTQAFVDRYLAIHDEQARSARSELDRLRSLIDDASQRLMSSFDVIREFSVSHRALVGDVVTQDIDLAVGNAISALQFQDMATQLLGHASQRIALLERISEPLGRLPQVSVVELTQALAGTPAERSSGPVVQACMNGGSVELF
jgi:hypothetical protein